MSEHFKVTLLLSDENARARFYDHTIVLPAGSTETRLSNLLPNKSLQFRQSPVGFQSAMHCTEKPQWLFVLQGVMEIELANGDVRSFKAGDCFYSADVLPKGAKFDATIHGHKSRNIDDVPLVTLFAQDEGQFAKSLGFHESLIGHLKR